MLKSPNAPKRTAERLTNCRTTRSLTARQVIDLHIKRLKEYNELRDAGLRLAQLVADEKGCRIKEVFEEMGYSMKDD